MGASVGNCVVGCDVFRIGTKPRVGLAVGEPLGAFVNCACGSGVGACTETLQNLRASLSREQMLTFLIKAAVAGMLGSPA